MSADAPRRPTSRRKACAAVILLAIAFVTEVRCLDAYLVSLDSVKYGERQPSVLARVFYEEGARSATAGLIIVPTAALFLLWLTSARRDLERIRGTALEPIGLVRAFFIPPWMLYRPYQIVRDLMRRSAVKEADASILPGAYAAAEARGAPVGAWWAGWLLGRVFGGRTFMIVGLLSGWLIGGGDIPEVVFELQIWIAGTVVLAASAVLAIRIIVVVDRNLHEMARAAAPAPSAVQDRDGWSFTTALLAKPWLWAAATVVAGATFAVPACRATPEKADALRTAPSPTTEARGGLDRPPASSQASPYADARARFQTRLVRRGPAPQPYEHDSPPPDAREIPYRSGELTLKAWVSTLPADGRRAPAVLFLHGGFAFGREDWDQAKPYRDAGFVVLAPMLRGENGLPGDFSMFFSEIDDVLAAAEVLAGLPYVYPDHLYVAGHSIGGTHALLAAMLSSRFRAAASFSGSPDQVAWTSGGREEQVPFDPHDANEFRIRSPLAYATSFQCPVRAYYGSAEHFFAAPTIQLANLAQQKRLDVRAVSVPGDHMSHVAEAMRQSIEFFREKE